jgi:hypothetical protein
MNKPEENDRQGHQAGHRIRLPGFLVDKDIGLGDIIKQATSSMGITPCTGCEGRASSLNKWVAFGPGKRR